MINQTFDIVVIGGGIIGLSAALAMQQRNHSVAVIDTADISQEVLPGMRVYAINALSQQVLQALTVWELIERSKLSPYERMSVFDAENGAAIHFDARQIAKPNLGNIVEESLLKNALMKKVKETSITLLMNTIVSEIKNTSEGVAIKTDHSYLTAKLLIIADGAMSSTRMLLNIPAVTWPYHQQAIVCNVHTELPHQHTAYQIFNSDGPLAFLPLPDAHACSIVLSTSMVNAMHLMQQPEYQFEETLTRAFQNKLGAIKITSKRYQFPLTMRHVKQYRGPGWLIMGDAAHTIHPLAGLGLNVGFSDLNTWISLFDQNKAWTSKTLSAYQRNRKNEVWQVIMVMESLKMMFANPLLSTPRKLGLSICNQFLPIKRWLMLQAAGY